MQHGGDIYRNKVNIDFSVNINPLGIPDSVKRALLKAVGECDKYPDIKAEELMESISKMAGIKKDSILLGNGASELFMAVVHAVHPKRIVIPVPSFYGYERTAASTGAEVIYYEMKEKFNFCLDEGIKEFLTEGTDLLFLANPNNPVGNMIEDSLLEQIAKECKKKQILIVLDECFLEFTGEEEKRSFKNKLKEYPNVVVVRAFTKIFAIPGVRLGYLFCENQELRDAIRKQIPEWNLSVFAQTAGRVACEEADYMKRTVHLVKEEREYLTSELEQIDIKVYPSHADYLLLKTELPLYEMLLGKEILIRDCRNFRGLEKGYYRIAVKNHAENEQLINTIKRIKKFEATEKTEEIEFVLPEEIEKRSFEIISEELKEKNIELKPEQEMVTKRVIHTSADFDYADTLTFSKGAVEKAKELIKNGADIVTDTNMALAGINKTILAHYGGQAHCFMAEKEVSELAKQNHSTRAAVSMEMAAKIEKPVIFAIGNAPTALLKLHEMIEKGTCYPAFIIGVPVGFVNVVPAKELIITTDIPFIINRGRKGGSNVAAAIVNAILYEMEREGAAK
ncbi:precorrin-8X methylmutase [Anaerocolumna xylanovorans]|uniref:Precorrin-8X methylmutase n=1 Tax=Anaerocolumna xylanovorans DSM 12503 TaxID=1121345 RepID=A0A1M7XYT6_9FIRM|nr:precorrin-8X methylmutase [Anaerocolumna xylanovorans]SHO44204.1 precorrin-8X methylmutase [Anaerocolumna xylanovorans DSM 12503]